MKYKFEELEGQEAKLILDALGELPAKLSRVLLNKLEVQIVRQEKPPLEPPVEVPVNPDASPKA